MLCAKREEKLFQKLKRSLLEFTSECQVVELSDVHDIVRHQQLRQHARDEPPAQNRRSSVPRDLLIATLINLGVHVTETAVSTKSSYAVVDSAYV